MVSRGRRGAHIPSPGPGLLADVKPNQVIEHGFAIVPAEHVDGVLVRYGCVLAASVDHINKLLSVVDDLVDCQHKNVNKDMPH